MRSGVYTPRVTSRSLSLHSYTVKLNLVPKSFYRNQQRQWLLADSLYTFCRTTRARAHRRKSTKTRHLSNRYLYCIIFVCIERGQRITAELFRTRFFQLNARPTSTLFVYSVRSRLYLFFFFKGEKKIDPSIILLRAFRCYGFDTLDVRELITSNV